MDPNDDGYLEALVDETELLQQRVDACRSHAQYLAFFQPGDSSFLQSPTSGGSNESPHWPHHVQSLSLCLPISFYAFPYFRVISLSITPIFFLATYSLYKDQQ